MVAVAPIAISGLYYYYKYLRPDLLCGVNNKNFQSSFSQYRILLRYVMMRITFRDDDNDEDEFA